MGEKKEDPGASGDKEQLHCTEECMIGLEECAECGACVHCSDGAHLDEDELPHHWKRFIENSKKST